MSLKLIKLRNMIENLFADRKDIIYKYNLQTNTVVDYLVNNTLKNNYESGFIWKTLSD